MGKTPLSNAWPDAHERTREGSVSGPARAYTKRRRRADLKHRNRHVRVHVPLGGDAHWPVIKHWRDTKPVQPP